MRRWWEGVGLVMVVVVGVRLLIVLVTVVLRVPQVILVILIFLPAPLLVPLGVVVGVLGMGCPAPGRLLPDPLQAAILDLRGHGGKVGSYGSWRCVSIIILTLGANYCHTRPPIITLEVLMTNLHGQI